jgi:hypothetical protein
MAKIVVPISVGELLDKITILTIKTSVLKNPERLNNVLIEKESLEAICCLNNIYTPEIIQLVPQLLDINMRLWVVEDNIRESENKKDFGPIFIYLARQVYYLNDRRSEIKREINKLSSSVLVEEKEYTKY